MAQQRQADAALVALVASYQAQTIGLRNRLERFVRATWRGLRTYRNAQMTAFLNDVLPAVSGAQQQMASLTTAFLAHQEQLALGGRFSPVAVDPKKVTGAAVRNGTSPEEVYSRPFHLTWRELHDLPHEDGAIEKAIDMGEDRAADLALTDAQLAKTHTARQVARHSDRVKYVRRILEGPQSCGLCIVASTQRYHPGILMPIHGGCDCDQEFVYADKDPGNIIDLDTLQDVHAKIEGRFGASSPGARTIPGNNYDAALQYRDILITHEHGELGPVLGVRGQEFTGPKDVHVPARPKRGARDIDAERTTDQLRATLAELERSQAKFESPGTRARIDDLQAKIAARD